MIPRKDVLVLYQRRISIDEKLANEVKKIASETGNSENAVIEKAISQYINTYFMQNKSSFLNDNILSAMQGISDRMEMRLNHKTNQVLSELAIQVSIMEQILGNSLEVDGTVLSKFRQNAVEFLKTNQRLLRMDEVIE